MDASARNSKSIFPKKAQGSRSDPDTVDVTYESKISIESVLNRISQTELSKYCPRQLFYIFFINESNENSRPLVENLIKLNEVFQDLSDITFISQEEVLDLLKFTDDRPFPIQLKPALLSLIETQETSNNKHLALQSHLIKLKLIEVMYQQYVKEVQKNEKQSQLDSLLNTLSKECRKKQKKDEAEAKSTDQRQKTPTKDDGKKKEDKLGKETEIDYTTIPIKKDEISYEENIYNYMKFYCFTGFYDADIVKTIVELTSMPLTGIIEVSNHSKVQASIHDAAAVFWQNIKTCFVENTDEFKSLEQTVLMSFTPDERPNRTHLSDLEEFVYMLRKLISAKLTHLNYLKSLAVNKIRHIYPIVPIDCLTQYGRFLSNIPLECINSEVLLHGLIEEVYNYEIHPSKNFDGSGSKLLAKPYPTLQCIDPLRQFQSRSIEPNLDIIEERVQTYLTHENNLLEKILKSYKSGSKVAGASWKFLKLFPIFNDNVYKTSEFIHLHDVNPEDLAKSTNEGVENFMYLFLFNNILSKKNIETTKGENWLLNNLVTFDLEEFSKEAQPKLLEINNNQIENLYDTSLMHFRWKELLDRNMTVQEIATAADEYLYVKKRYSPETDNFLVTFSNELDSFGVNIKVYDIVIRTPVCFRDFCRYVSLKDSNWISSNQSKISENTISVSFKDINTDVKRIKTDLSMFQEYFYLLDGNLVETKQESSEKLESSSATFDEVLKELHICNQLTGEALVQEYQNLSGNKMIAYDLGSNIFKITGKLTTFCSLDNVKVTVDNSRLLQQPEKCTFKVSSNGHTLILHSRESIVLLPYVACLLLKDGTRIGLVLQSTDTSNESTSEFSYEIVEEKQVHNKYEDPSKENLSVAEEIPIVHCVEQEFFKEITKGKSIHDLSVNSSYNDLLDALTETQNTTIYKVREKSNYFQQNIKDFTIPLESALKNIVSIENVAGKSPETSPKKFYTNNKKRDKMLISPIDIRLCLPNGLYIRTQTCPVNNSHIMIRQQYSQPNVHEEFRLFSNEGFVLIKKIDSTLTILAANGDCIILEKPIGFESERNSCRCSTLDDYRIKLNKLLKHLDTSEYSISRRGHISSKHNQILDKRILKILEEFNVPYSKKTLIKFDGTRIKVVGDRIHKKQLHFMTRLQDFTTGDENFERSDDFRAVFYKNGAQKMVFPDGTIISCTTDFADELLDGFVVVVMTYRFENQYYATIKFDANKRAKIELAGGATIQETKRGNFLVNADAEVSVTLTEHSIDFRKICLDCSEKLVANFDMEPFRRSNWMPNQKFMDIQDSCGKKFTADFVGNCFRNSDQPNPSKCDHFTRTDYRKLFVVNRNLSGMSFCTKDVFMNKIKYVQNQQNCSVVTYSMISTPKVITTDFREDFYTKFCDRFYNMCCLKEIAHLFKKDINSTPFYTTFRMFDQMFESADEIQNHISNISKAYFEDYLDQLEYSRIYENIGRFSNMLTKYLKKYKNELINERQQLTKLNGHHLDANDKNGLFSSKCECKKKYCTVEEKMLNWKNECRKFKALIRQKKIPNYFNSDFCRKLPVKHIKEEEIQF